MKIIILIYKITKKCNRRPILQTPIVIALQSQRAMTNQNENIAGNNANETQSQSIPGENHIADEEANHDRPPSYMEVMAQSYSISMNS